MNLYTRAAVGCAAAAVLIISACDNAPPAPRAHGYGTARVALNVSSIYELDDGDLKGRILLINEDGSLSQQTTDGIYIGTVSLIGDTLFSSDAHQEWVLTRDAATSVPRKGQHVLEWDSVTTDDARWVVFNDGAGEQGYRLGISVTDGTRVSEAEILGDPYGQAGCGDAAMMVTHHYSGPNSRKTTSRLHTLTWDGHRITEKNEIVASPFDTPVKNLACVENRPVLLARSKLGLHVGTRKTPMSPWRWRTRQVGLSLDSRIAGSIGETIFVDTGGKVIALDIKTMNRRVLVDQSDQNFTARVQEDSIVAWWERDDKAQIVQLDPHTGAEMSRLDASKALKYLNAHNETVIRPPILLPEAG